jgi:tripartite-type tricarboxylate transporter receptor subunit TctC
MKMTFFLKSTLAAIVGTTMLAGVASAQSVKDFYKSARIKMLISSSPGGGYDTYARLVARHIVRHIPGASTIVPVNMPGAGGVRMANFMYVKAPRDGSHFGHVQRGVAFEPIFGNRKAIYDALKFTWLGSLNESIAVMFVRADVPINSIQDAMTKTYILGDGGGDAQLFAVATNNIIGTKFKIISRYPGSSEARLAIMRGELQGMSALSLSSLMTQAPTWIKEKKIKILLQFGLRKHPSLDPKIPLILDLAKTKEDRAILETIFSRQKMARPFFAPPEVPAARAKALRTALMSTTRDEKFLAAAKRRRLEINAIPHTEIEAIIKRIYGLPKSLIEKTRAALSNRPYVSTVKLLKVKTANWSLQKKGKRSYIVFKDKKGEELKLRIHSRRTKGKIAGKKVRGAKAVLKVLKPGMNCEIRYVGKGGNAVRLNCG